MNKQFTDAEISKQDSQFESAYRQYKEQKTTLQEFLKFAKDKREEFSTSKDSGIEPSQARKDFWKKLGDTIFRLEKSAGPKFKPTDILDSVADGRIDAVRSLINKMTDSQESEQNVLEALDALNDYGKYISKDHPELKQTRQMYFDKQAINYMNVAKDPRVNQSRKNILKKKLETNLALGKYSKPEEVQSIMNLLEGVLPEAKPEASKEPAKKKAGSK